MAFNPDIICPDISFWQDDPNTAGQVNFHRMKEAGAQGVIIRAGQHSWIDEDFVYNWAKAKEAGLLRGAYWFYDSRSAPNNQAAMFINIVGEDRGELGLWLDLEENYGGTYSGWQNWKKCLNYLKTARDDIGIYTAPAYWKRNRPADPIELSFFAQFPLWIANYGVSQPEIPAPWTLSSTWFWQYTSKGDGLRYGAESLGIDLNMFNGTQEEFNARFGGVVQPPEGERMQYRVVWSKGVARRAGPSTSFASNGTPYGFMQVVDVLEDNIPDANDPTNANKRWVRFADGLYGASDYPDSLGIPRVRMAKVADPSERQLVKGVLHWDDGSITELFPRAQA